MEKGEESLFPTLGTAELGERRPGAAYSMIFCCRVLKSCLFPPSILFHLDSIAMVCGGSIASATENAEPSPSTHKPPPGAVILADTHKRHCLGWAPRFSFGNRLITSSTHPGCGKGIQPDLLPCRASLAVRCNLSSRHLSVELSWGSEPLHRARRGGNPVFCRCSFPTQTCSASARSIEGLPCLVLGVRYLHCPADEDAGAGLWLLNLDIRAAAFCKSCFAKEVLTFHAQAIMTCVISAQVGSPSFQAP